MLNFIQGTTGTAVIYADTISNNEISFTDNFLFAFKSTYSKRKVYIYPEVDVRNDRYIQFTVRGTYLQEMQNWTYECWNLADPCEIWNLDEDFWNESETIWNTCSEVCQFWNNDEDFWNNSKTIWDACNSPAPDFTGAILIDKGQMFLTPA